MKLVNFQKGNKMKNRHHLNKSQNNYNGNYQCKNYDTLSNGTEFCHDEGQSGWGEFIKWSKIENGKLKCKGNRHNCYKLKLKWLASLRKNSKEIK